MKKICTFFRAVEINEDKKDKALFEMINSIKKSELNSSVFQIPLEKFSKIPGSPFAYWISDTIRDAFQLFPQFENNERIARLGLATSDDFRFIRLWWETAANKIGARISQNSPKNPSFINKKWIYFTNIGDASPYYADIQLLINWELNGAEIKEWANKQNNYKGWSRSIRSVELYFQPGFTWPLKGGYFSPKILPSGCIFSVRSYASFVNKEIMIETLGLFNSAIFDYFYKIMLGRFEYPDFVAGVLQKMPWPLNLNESHENFRHSIIEIVTSLEQIEKSNELNHNFTCSFLISAKGVTLNEKITNNLKEKDDSINRIAHCQKEINEVAFSLFNIPQEDRMEIEKLYINRPLSFTLSEIEPFNLTKSLISYLLGSLFGRWDIRYATGQKQPPNLPDPFAPLPACSPGMLQGEDGLPLLEAPSGYPLKIDDDGILVDDEFHPEDIITRLREVLTLLWGEKADSIEQEACEILGVKSLREYFRKPTAGGFWDSHVKRYSKSRRKAPIYWLLQSSKKNYALWIYYHRLTPDTLFRALERYVKPKIQMEENRLAEMQSELKNAGTGGAAVKKLEKAVEKQELFVGELSDFKEKLERAASLFLEPDLDDGAVLTIAPLHELVPWKEASAYWEELLEGKYEWSSIGKQLREKGLVKE